MRVVLIIMLILGWQLTAVADELAVVLNGKSIHLEGGDFNEKNWGLGINYDWTPKNNWITFLNASYFEDSNSNFSKYAGGGMKRRFNLDGEQDGWRADVGGIAFFMTRVDYKNNDPFIGVLPFAALSYGPMTVNMTYIPRVSPKHKELLFFQLMVRIATF